MQLDTYLVFNGQCEEAFRFYADVLGGNIEGMMTHEGSPLADEVPAEWGKKILHARMTAGNGVLMGCDCPPDRYEAPRGFSVSIQVKDPKEAERLFDALAKNGKVEMPIQQTFWSPRFGMLVDRFGIPWMVNCEGAAQHAS
jgi:PhnB protein